MIKYKLILLAVFMLLGVSIIAQEEYPLVFIHGINTGHEKWREIAKKYNPENYWEIRSGEKGTIVDNYIVGKRAGREVWNVSYYTPNAIDEGLKGTLERYATRVELMIEKIKLYSGKDKVVIIAHSMGGLIARRYMTLSQENYNSVYKIVTVTSPNMGEKVIPPIGNNQVRDMAPDSTFMKRLNIGWGEYKNISEKWGVIGAIDSKNIFNKKITADSTDSAGVGFITISSAVPYGEWQRVYEKKDEIVTDSKYFAFAVIVDDNHNDVLYNPIIAKAVDWALK